MNKNVASQKIQLFAFDATTGVPKTGDAANLTAYVSIDYGSVTVLGDTSATEMDATNAPGWYMFDLTQAETNGNDLLFTGKSSTSNIKIVGRPICTVPASFQAFVTPTDAAVNVTKWNGTTVATPATAGIPDVNAKNINNVAATSVTTINANLGTTQPVNFTGTGASALAKSDMVDIAGAAVSTSAAQIGVNAVQIGGTVQTGLDLGGNIGTAGVNLTNLGGMSTTMKGQVQTEAEEALVTYNLDHLMAVAAVAGDVVNSSVIARLASKSATPAFTSYDNTTDSLEAVSDKVTAAGTALDAAGIRAAVGLATANLDTQLGDIPTVAEFNARTLVAASYATAAALATAQVDISSILAIVGTTGVVLSAAAIDALWDEVMEGSTTARQSMRLSNSANGGKTNGGGTSTFNIRDLADTKNRVQATVDINGNRSAITRDLT